MAPHDDDNSASTAGADADAPKSRKRPLSSDSNERSVERRRYPDAASYDGPTGATSAKDAMLVSLYDVFVERGYHGASLADLARGCGRGKASLYHHFPGGKREMLETLIRLAAERLETLAYRHLRRTTEPGKRLQRFIDGFAEYTDDGRRNCLLGVLGATSPELLSDGLRTRFDEWQSLLEATLREAGAGKKSARHLARSVMSRLYGSLAIARLNPHDDTFSRTCKRLKKELSGKSLGD